MANNSPRFREVFFSGNFFLFWVGQVISQFGERLTQMALIGLIYESGIISTQAISNLLIAMILPVFIFGPIAGVYVDRWDRKKTLIAADIIRALLVFSITLFSTKNLIPIYLLVFLIFAATRFFMPAKTAIIPEVMDPEQLRIANSISSTSKMIATILGLSLGGFIVTYFGSKMCFYIDAVTFLISGISIAFMKRKNIQKHAISQTALSLKKQFLEGIKEIKKNPHIYFLVKTLSLLMAAGGAIFVIFPVFVNKQFNTYTNGLSMLISTLGAGLFVGALILGKCMHKTTNKKMISASIVLVAILFIILANLHNVYLACFVMFIIGLVGSPIIICTETLIQEMVDDKMIGRVYSVIEIIIHAAFLLAMWVTGLVGNIASPGFIFSILGSVFAVIMLILITKDLLKVNYGK